MCKWQTPTLNVIPVKLKVAVNGDTHVQHIQSIYFDTMKESDAPATTAL